jgi:hypothetical protein
VSQVLGHFVKVDDDFSVRRFFDMKQLILEFDETWFACWCTFLSFHEKWIEDILYKIWLILCSFIFLKVLFLLKSMP